MLSDFLSFLCAEVFDSKIIPSSFFKCGLPSVPQLLLCVKQNFSSFLIPAFRYYWSLVSFWNWLLWGKIHKLNKGVSIYIFFLMQDRLQMTIILQTFSTVLTNLVIIIRRVLCTSYRGTVVFVNGFIGNITANWGKQKLCGNFNYTR